MFSAPGKSCHFLRDHVRVARSKMPSKSVMLEEAMVAIFEVPSISFLGCGVKLQLSYKNDIAESVMLELSCYCKLSC